MRIDNNSYGAINAYGRIGVGGNNGCRGNPRTSGDFGDILQERVSKVAASESGVKESAAVKFDLTNRVLDLSDVEAVGKYDGFSDDPELRAYGRQIALESGIAFMSDADPEKVKERQGEFLYLLNQLMDKGLISRQEIIDAAEFPPKEVRKEDGSRGYELDMNGYEKKMKDMELTADLNLLKMIKR